MLAILAQSGGQWQNYIQVIVIILAISASAIGALLKKLMEQRALREQKLGRERQREAMLRTGRVDEQRERAAPPEMQAQSAAPPLPNIVPEDEARRRLQELAQRRRAELAEMARRAQSGGAPAAPSPAPAPISQPGMRRSAPPPVQTKSEHRSSPPLPTRPGMLTPQSEQDIRHARAQAGKDKAARDKAARKAAAHADRQRELERRQRAEREREEDRRAADEVPHLAHDQNVAMTAIGSAPAVRGDGPQRTGRPGAAPITREDWRKAFIASELLQPPLALREDDHLNR